MTLDSCNPAWLGGAVYRLWKHNTVHEVQRAHGSLHAVKLHHASGHWHRDWTWHVGWFTTATCSKLSNCGTHSRASESPFTKLGCLCTKLHLRVMCYIWLRTSNSWKGKKHFCKVLLEEQVTPDAFLLVCCTWQGPESIFYLSYFQFMTQICLNTALCKIILWFGLVTKTI